MLGKCFNLLTIKSKFPQKILKSKNSSI